MARIVSGPYVSGRVTSKQTGTPISGVTVTVSPAVYTTVEMTSSTTSLTTDGAGVFVCYALPGTYTFTTTAVDAAPIESVEILGAEGLGADRSSSGTFIPRQGGTALTVAALPVFNVKDYGATGDGVTDDTAAVQAALTAVPASGAAIVFPVGDYLIPNGGLTCANQVHLLGVGGNYSSTTGPRLSMTAASGTCVTLSAPGSRVEGLTIRHAITGTRNADLIGLALTNANYSRVTRCRIKGFSTNLTIDTGVYWSVAESSFSDPVLAGIDVRYTGSPDAGDGTILGCTIERSQDTTTTGGVGIHATSIGGVRITSCKIITAGGSLHGFDYGIQYEVGNAQTSSIFQVTGGSIEGVKTAAVGFTFASGATSGELDSVQINGVQLNGLTYAGSIGVLANGPVLRGFNVTGCSFNMLTTGVDFQNCVNTAITGNTHRTIAWKPVYNRSGNSVVRAWGANSWDAGLIAYDSFTRTATTDALGPAELGGGWQAINSLWTVNSSGQAASTSAATCVAALDAGTTICKVSCDVPKVSGTGNAGPAARIADASNLLISRYDPTTGLLSLSKVIAGTVTSVATAALAAPADGTLITVTISCTSATLVTSTAFYNGSAVATVNYTITDAVLQTPTKYGIRGPVGGVTWLVDNFQISAV